MVFRFGAQSINTLGASDLNGDLGRLPDQRKWTARIRPNAEMSGLDLLQKLDGCWKIYRK